MLNSHVMAGEFSRGWGTNQNRWECRLIRAANSARYKIPAVCQRRFIPSLPSLEGGFPYVQSFFFHFMRCVAFTLRRCYALRHFIHFYSFIHFTRCVVFTLNFLPIYCAAQIVAFFTLSFSFLFATRNFSLAGADSFPLFMAECGREAEGKCVLPTISFDCPNVPFILYTHQYNSSIRR